MNIRILLSVFLAGSCLSMLADQCNAQVYIVGSPVYGGPVIVQRPIVAQPLVVSAGYAESYAVGYAPYATYRPVVPTTYVVPAPVEPVVTYRPVSPYATYSIPYAVARPVVVRPKVYVPGQPVRNAVRAVTP